MISTVLSQKRLHIAHDADYQGNINSYNNWVTKSFSKLFKLSTTITINNETKCVNKKSYLKLLPELGVNVPEGASVKAYRNFDGLTCAYLKNRGLMRQHISSNKSNALGYQFVHAIVANDMQRATHLIGKGANIDLRFWQREESRITFSDDVTYGLPYRTLIPYKATRFTPFLFAVSKNNKHLIDLLENYKANTGILGEKIKVNRKITKIYSDASYKGLDEFKNRTQFSYDSSTKELKYNELYKVKVFGWNINHEGNLMSYEHIYNG